MASLGKRRASDKSSSAKRRRVPSLDKRNAQAPTTPHATHEVFLPQEISRIICSLLPRSDLKAVRLVSHQFDISAQEFLFHTIFLRVNLQSFLRLKKIAQNRTLQQHVKAIQYDGRSLWLSNQHPTYADWLERNACEGFEIWNRETQSQFLANFSQTQLRRFYHRYCSFLDDQLAICASDIGLDILKEAVDQLPNLQQVEYDVVPQRSHKVTDKSQMTFEAIMDSLSPIAREILAEPHHSLDYKMSHRNFWALIKGAALSQHTQQLRTLRGHELSLEQWIASSTLIKDDWQGLKKLQHLQLDFDFARGEKPEDIRELARLISDLPQLKSLSLSFDSLSTEVPLTNVRLPQLLSEQHKWPFLEELSIQAVVTTERHLRQVLLAHAQTLRTLRLSNIDFITTDGIPDKELGRGSWIGFIQFLSQDMSLSKACFDGALSNCWDEGWLTRDSPREFLEVPTASICDQYPSDCLKYRIERYITDGGEFPFKAAELTADDVLQTWDYESWAIEEGLPWTGKWDNSWVFEGRLLQ